MVFFAKGDKEMNLREFANVDSYYRDLDTGKEVPWKEYMARVIGKLGLHNIKPYIPFGLDFIREKLKEDEHLNNTAISQWDYATGFISYINKNTKTQEYERTRYGLVSLFRMNGITCYSVSEGVCVLKEAARMLVREVHDEEKGDN